MTAEQFKQNWETEGETLNPFSKGRLQELNLDESTVNFLSVTGLPDSAAPFLSFVQPVGDKNNTIIKLRDIHDFLGPEYEQYVKIGSDGSGNPIVINTLLNDRIEWLDHEDGFTPYFFNTNIIGLAGCLIAQRDFVNTILNENGEDAVLDSDFTDEQFEKFKNNIINSDPEVLNVESFWKTTLDDEWAIREESRQG